MTGRAILISKIAGICIGLVALVWIVFGQTVGHPFINYDDGAYVFRNEQVMRGLSAQGIKWSLTHPVSGNWHPLTVLSHMLDCQFYGVAPSGHHFTNVVLHSLAVLLLFVALWKMTTGSAPPGDPTPTGTIWRSAFVAGIFAIHPLRVESVAWIAERKDVLSAVLFMLTIIAYLDYTRRPSFARYATTAVLFAAGLMAKPMLVTLPALLLLLDYWPLGRTRSAKRQAAAPFAARRFNVSRFLSLLAEKIPLFALSAASAIATVIAQSKEIDLANATPLGSRIGNAFVSLVIYLRQTFWPKDLAVFYPKRALPIWEVIVAIAVVLAISAAAFVLRRQRPYLLVGWLWFAGMLVPVIGIIQVGGQAHADRYTYLPQIGLCLAVTWGAADLFATVRSRRVILGAASFTVLLALTCSAYIQTKYWRSSEALWQHAVAVTSDNENAYEHLSEAYLERGRVADAVAAAQHAVDGRGDSAYAHGVLGAALTRQGKINEAIEHLRKAIELDPKLPRAHFNLANAVAQRGDSTEAIAEYKTELESYPDSAESHNNLANVLLRTGKVDEALEHLQKALYLNPNYPEARNNLAIALSQKGQISKAVAEWNKTLAIDPNNLEAQCNLGWVLSTSSDSSVRNGTTAVELTQRALRLSGGKNARIWRLTAAAYAEAGQFESAIKAAQNGIAIAEKEGNAALVQTLESNIKLFEQRMPLRD